MSELAESVPETVDLTNCDREPIHIPDHILPHGAMLVLHPKTLTIEQVAGDCEGLLGISPQSLIGGALADLFTDSQVEHLRELIARSPLQHPRHLLHPLLTREESHPVDASIHLSDECLVIELEEADLADRHFIDPLACVQEMFDGLDGTDDLQSFCQRAAEKVHAVMGYDRVMVYRFLSDDSGWVFAEAKREGLNPFLDLHCPASDIPKQARALYLTNTLRIVTEVDYEPAPLQPTLNPRTGKTLDMSLATLRDVSPIHREYLRNMGVAATMTISIVVEGRLWGMIVSHHNLPRRLPRHLRAVCELFGSMFSLQLEARLRAEKLQARLDSRKALGVMLETLVHEADYAAGLVAQADKLLEYISAGGLALRAGQSRGGLAIQLNSGITSLGQTPDNDQIGALTDWLTRQMKDFEGVFLTDRLGEIWPRAKEFADVGSGLLAVSVSREPRDFILWFRPEVIETVTWGGDPRKPVELGPNGDRLTPRKSFEAWSETVSGRSAPWSSADEDAAFDLRVSLLEVVLRRIDAAARERLRAWEQEKLLMAELDHRVKNTLANVQALVAQTGRSASSLIAFTEGLESRIRSMSRAHNLLTKSRWQGMSMHALLHEELDAHAVHGREMDLQGPAVQLTPKAALATSLAIHELATNAAKYGALSSVNGEVSVTWAVRHDGGLEIIWRENGGPTVVPPQRRGFGSSLIERALAIETDGESFLRFEPSGVVCTILLPVSAIHMIESEAVSNEHEQAAPTPMIAATANERRRIFIVEDSALVVMTLEAIVGELGHEVVGPATNIAKAIAVAKEEAICAALLDVNLHGQMSWEVADVLAERGIPFTFTTGYDGATVLPDRFADRPVIGKPYGPVEIADALSGLLQT